jgi:hypothetical protein
MVCVKQPITASGRLSKHPDFQPKIAVANILNSGEKVGFGKAPPSGALPVFEPSVFLDSRFGEPRSGF